MCGVAGYWNRNGEPASGDLANRMLDAIAHRGPDDRGLWCEGGLAIGHVRLSVLDPTPRAHQPLVTGDGQGVIAYNGEVYNFAELRTELEREGVAFASTGDTEVVLNAIHQWGPDRAIPRFNGMFALAYYDRRSHTLCLARDRLGIKPMYVTRRRDPLVFGSEPKALLRHPAVDARPDMLALTAYMLTHHIDDTRSAFDGVEPIEPGCYWLVTDASIEVTRYFSIERDLDVSRIVEPDAEQIAAAPGRFTEDLAESIRIHLASDVPVATMCSGGVDSSLITALVRRFRTDLPAYVANVSGTDAEGPIAQRVAAHLGIPVRQVDVGEAEYLRLWANAVWYDDQPSPHPNDAPMLAVARACRRDGVEVVLTGEGSDELFGGYGWQRRTYERWLKWRRRGRWQIDARGPWRFIPRRVRAILRRTSLDHMIEAPFDQSPLRQERQVREFAARLTLDPERFDLGSALTRNLLPVGEPEDAAFLASCLYDMHGHLRSLLHRNDRMLMGAGVESRVPFLENRLIDTAMHMHRAMKLRGGVGKWIVKSAAEPYLPKSIVHAPKIGFAFPQAPWIKAVALLEGGMVPELLGWTRLARRDRLTAARRDAWVCYRLASMEIWARTLLDGQNPDAVGEQLVRLAG